MKVYKYADMLSFRNKANSQ